MIIRADSIKSNNFAEVISELEARQDIKDLGLTFDAIEAIAVHIVMTDTDFDLDLDLVSN